MTNQKVGGEIPAHVNRPIVRPSGGPVPVPAHLNRPIVRPNGGPVPVPAHVNRPIVRPNGGPVPVPAHVNKPVVRPNGGPVPVPSHVNKPVVRPNGVGVNPVIPNVPGSSGLGLADLGDPGVNPKGPSGGGNIPKTPNKPVVNGDIPNMPVVNGDIPNVLSNVPNFNHGLEAVVFGLGAFTAGVLASSLMDWGISNPPYPVYITQPNYVVLPPIQIPVEPDIIQPQTIAVNVTNSSNSQQLRPEPASEPSVEYLANSAYEQARQAYINGDYNGALERIEAALASFPNEVAFLQFRGICLISLDRYNEAATTINTVLSMDYQYMTWTTLSSFYENIDTFTMQMRRLEAFSNANHLDPSAHLLLAYIYLCTDQIDPCKGQLDWVVSLRPGDPIATGLLARLNSTPEAGNSTQNPVISESDNVVSAESVSTPAEVLEGEVQYAPNLDSIIGKFTAKITESNLVTLELGADSRFKWSVSSAGVTQVVLNGNYEYSEGLLTLVSVQNDKKIQGWLWEAPDSQFRLTVLNSPPNDPGLLFSR